jgi:hypothetical protein
MRNPSLRLILILVATGGLVSCSSQSPTSSSSTDTRSIQASPSFSATIQEIFDRRSCTSSSCHGTAQMAGLDLRAGVSYGSLVDVRATSEPFPRVSPGDPDGSYLVIKLEGRQSVGSRMPQTGSPLDSIDLANIRNWISQGAPND